MKKVMVGYDSSDEARDALALGNVLSQATNATLILAGVVEADFPYGPGSDDFRIRQEERLREELEDAAIGIGVEPDLRVITARSPARGLHDLAEGEAADILVLGSSHRSGLGRVLAGSVTERVLQGAPCAIAVAPRGFRNQAQLEPRVIAVGFDGFPESRRALANARELAEACGAALRVIAVQEADLISGYQDVPGYGDRGTVVRSERERLEKALNEAVGRLPLGVRPQGSLLPGSAAEVLARAAETGVDLLVVGSRGYGPVRRVLLGGVSSALVRSAPCPILVVPRGEAVESEDEAAEDTSAVHA
jgi:nucleotide-binding universal stress UspA family protein